MCVCVCVGQTYVACDWVSEVKEKCYDAELAEASNAVHS